MNTSRSALPIDALLAHEGFVRSLARSLVQDSATADDVAQETWITVLKSTPQADSSLRGWLARIVKSRASNARRERTRRGEREQSTAKRDVDHSDAILRERLELAQSVVAAVLALDEPYRSVILQRYYEDLEPSEIARLRGVAPGTVRSQLSRGHELLRGKLDRKFGDRSAWSLALVALAQRGVPKSLALSAKILIGVGAAALVASAPIAWRAVSTRANSEPIAAATPEQRWAIDASFVLALAAPPSSSARQDATQDPSANTVERAELAKSLAPKAGLASKSIDELIALMVQTQRLLRTRVLDDSGNWPADLAGLKSDPQAGVFWLLPRGRFDFEESNPFGLRGGGAYYSFATRSHSYDFEPDIAYQDGELVTAFYGGQTGMILPLGPLALFDVPNTANDARSNWSDRTKCAWDVLWNGADAAPESRELARLGSHAPASVGETYAVRCTSPDEHDLLAAMTVLDARQNALRIAYRVLHNWPIEQRDGHDYGKLDEAKIAPAPDWVESLSTEEALVLTDSIRAEAEARLFSVRNAIRARFAGLGESNDCGVVRMLKALRFERVVTPRGGGAYWSFATRSRDFDDESDIGLGSDGSSGFIRASSAACLLLDAGRRELQEVAGWSDGAPSTLEPNDRDAVQLIWNSTPREWDGRGKLDWAAASALRARADELGLLRGAKALRGHSYLLRSDIAGKHDLVAAFEIVELDEQGMTIAWKVLKHLPVDQHK